MPHPGSIVERQCLELMGLTVPRDRRGLRRHLAGAFGAVNGRTGIPAEMAIRLSKAFGSTSETWLGMQMAYDLWQARDRAGKIALDRFVAA